MLPDVDRQRHLAELTGTAAERLARLVWESQNARRDARRTAVAVKAAPGSAFSPRRRWRYRFRPLGIAFTMYRTRAVREESLARLHALAIRVAREARSGRL